MSKMDNFIYNQWKAEVRMLNEQHNPVFECLENEIVRNIIPMIIKYRKDKITFEKKEKDHESINNTFRDFRDAQWALYRLNGNFKTNPNFDIFKEKLDIADFKIQVGFTSDKLDEFDTILKEWRKSNYESLEYTKKYIAEYSDSIEALFRTIILKYKDLFVSRNLKHIVNNMDWFKQGQFIQHSIKNWLKKKGFDSLVNSRQYVINKSGKIIDTDYYAFVEYNEKTHDYDQKGDLHLYIVMDGYDDKVSTTAVL